MNYPTKMPDSTDQAVAVIPAEGLKGLVQNWRADVMAAFTVALVALPLALGIALASKFPPISGIISAVVGGLLFTFYRGSFLAIVGPAAGLIVVVISTVEAFDGNLQHALGVFCVAGILQTIFGLLRLGRFGDFFPNSVINGMLAAIGIIIISKQTHIALGLETEAIPHSSFDALLAIPNSIINMNPIVGLITFISLLTLIFHHKVKLRFARMIPAPMWVLLLVIPLALVFHLNQNHIVNFLGNSYQLGSHLLIQIPENPLGAIQYPSFEKIDEPIFWALSITIALIASIETLLISKAIDKLDPYRRKSNFNKDLIGVGIASTFASLIGGLPIITVIARSSVNVQNGAKTKWSNFYHSIILLLLVLFFDKALQRIPMAALAAILVYTGYKLASPKVFSSTYKKGSEQSIILLFTIAITLIYGILWGILAGTLFTIFIHFLKIGIPPKRFIKSLLNPTVKADYESQNKIYLEFEGICNFVTLLNIKKALDNLDKRQHVVVGFAHAHLVDHTVLEYLHDFSLVYEAHGGIFDIVGLGKHASSTAHPHSLHLLPAQRHSLPQRLTQRQKRLSEIAKANRWKFTPRITWDTSHYRTFPFLKTRPIEHASNNISGKFNSPKHIHWNISDITFNEGALLVRTAYHTTVLTLSFNFPLPEFILSKGSFLDTNTDKKEIHLSKFPHFTKKYTLKGFYTNEVAALFTSELVQYLIEHEGYHIESKDNTLLIFKRLRLSSPQEISIMHQFAEGFVKLLALVKK